MYRWAHISSKNNDISCHASIRQWKFWTQIKPYVVAATSVFIWISILSFTVLSKQLSNLKSVFKFLNHGISVLEIYKFTTYLRIEMLFFVKQCRLKFTSHNKWWSTKVGAKLLSDLVIFSILSSEILLNFQDSIRQMPPKYLMYFLAGINIK